MWKKFKKMEQRLDAWYMRTPSAILYIFMYLIVFSVVLATLATIFFPVNDTTPKNKSFGDMSQCQAHYELLLQNTKLIDIHTSYYRVDGSDGNTPIFILNFKSKDDSFSEGYRGYNLCDLIATSWDRIEAYDAYVNNKK